MQVLSADVMHIDSFGAARGIKHLMLEVPHIDCGRLSSSLSVLEQLQTLCIHVTEMPERETAGPLDLAALRSLRYVGLDLLVPESIKLGDTCELSVSQYQGWKMEHPVWVTVLPHLRSVTLEDDEHVLVGLPSFLTGARALVKASLSVAEVGNAAVPVHLHGALARVEELVVDCLNLHAVVPAHFAWRNITLAARNILDLRFEAVMSFAEAAPAFCFRYNNLQVSCSLAELGVCPSLACLLLRVQCFSWPPQGPYLLELAAVLARIHPEWKGHFREDPTRTQIGTSGLCFPLAQPPCSVWDALTSCRCGACSPCLWRDCPAVVMPHS